MKTVIDWSKAPEDCLGAVQLKEEFIESGDDYGIFVMKTKGMMEDGYHYCGHTNAGPQMERHEFIPKPKVKPVTSPTEPPKGATHHTTETNEESACWVKKINFECWYITKAEYTINKAAVWIPSKFDPRVLILITGAVPTFTQAMADEGVLPSVGMEYLCEDGQLNRCLVIEQDKIIGLMLEHVPFGGVLPISQSSLCDIKPLTPPIELIDGKAYQFKSRLNIEFSGIYNESRDILSVEQGQYFDAIAVTNIQLLEVKS